ncbi:MAG: hypothetical protein K9J13_09390 [Saprospiraceae bacterium]|nr:hypothetical protein [Saprospiraceae bacterium]
MEVEKGKTINYIKEKRTVSEKVKANRKEFIRIKKLIIDALKDEPKSIPQIAKETELQQDVVTYNLMTLLKYGEIETGEIDDMDEYFSYKLIQKAK